MKPVVGTSLLLKDQGDCWFPETPSEIEGVVQKKVRSQGDQSSWLVLELTEPLVYQSTGHDTQSGLGLERIERVLVRSRWQGVEIGDENEVSVFVCIVPKNLDLEVHLDGITAPDIWAQCSINSLDFGQPLRKGLKTKIRIMVAWISAGVFLIGGAASGLILFGLEPAGTELPFEVCMPAALIGSILHLASREKVGSKFLRYTAIWVLIVIGSVTAISLMMLAGH